MGETARVYRMDEAEKGCALKKSEGGGKGGRAGSRPMRRDDAAVD